MNVAVIEMVIMERVIVGMVLLIVEWVIGIVVDAVVVVVVVVVVIKGAMCRMLRGRDIDQLA